MERVGALPCRIHRHGLLIHPKCNGIVGPVEGSAGQYDPNAKEHPTQQKYAADAKLCRHRGGLPLRFHAVPASPGHRWVQSEEVESSAHFAGIGDAKYAGEHIKPTAW